MGEGLFIKNKKALFNYHVLETYEAGIELLGSEVKSIRARNINISNSYVAIKQDMQCYLLGANIKKYLHDNTFGSSNYVPDRPRRLLLHKRQIVKISSKVKDAGITIVPTALYFNKRNFVKIEIAIVKGKKEHDKRQSLKEKAIKLRDRREETQLSH